jgi:hypothetical protein
MSRPKTWKLRNLRQAEDDFGRLVAYDHEILQLDEGYHFRINGRLDVWPSTKKWYDIKSHAKGEYENLFTFVMLRFEDHETSTRS